MCTNNAMRREQMGINPKQLRELVIIPALKYLNPVIPYSIEAVDLLCMTAAHESLNGTYLKQIKGPALGIYQMEPATHDDIWKNFLAYNGEIAEDTIQYGSSALDLVTRLDYATAMARVHYYRVPEALPKCKDTGPDSDYIYELAKYAKKYYNTHLGKATADDYFDAFVKLYGGSV
jgi:hypothetical protein